MLQSPAAGAPRERGEDAAPSPKIGILVVAHSGSQSLAGVLERIPVDFRARVTELLIVDEGSPDPTHLVGLSVNGLGQDRPMTVIRRTRNPGYGARQKAGFRLAIEHGLDIIVLLNGNEQDAPGFLDDVVRPLADGACDAVVGSRVLRNGVATAGRTPLHERVGNRILSSLENRMLGTSLSGWRSGCRAYSVKALRAIPFERNSDGSRFDAQVMIQLVDAGKRITEMALRTREGVETEQVGGLRYAKDVCVDVLRYRLSKLGFTSGQLGAVDEEYLLKECADSSHGVILRWLGQLPPSRILDLGCSGGLLAARARTLGHHVTGVDIGELPRVRERVDRFFRCDLDHGLPAGVDDEGRFDVVICADVIEHVRDPEALLAQIPGVTAPGGVVIASIPNFGHWYARGRVALGLFDYDQRGILDRGHVRFFTRRSFQRMVRSAGYRVVRTEATGLPLDVLAPQGKGALKAALRTADRLCVALRPTLFAYQFAYQLETPPHV